MQRGEGLGMVGVSGTEDTGNGQGTTVNIPGSPVELLFPEQPRQMN